MTIPERMTISTCRIRPSRCSTGAAVGGVGVLGGGTVVGVLGGGTVAAVGDRVAVVIGRTEDAAYVSGVGS